MFSKFSLSYDVPPSPGASSLTRISSTARFITQTAQALQSGEMRASGKTPADLIFDLVRLPDTDEASVTKLIKVLRSFGILESDPRLKQVFERVRQFELEMDERDYETSSIPKEGIYMDRKKFKECIRPAVDLITQALRSHLVIPNWPEFATKIERIFLECRSIKDGEVASYIPQLKRQDPNLWGMSICTINGQRLSLGDSNVNFCIQSVSKAFTYAIVASDLGADRIHNYVGQEPSGRSFNDICLDAQGKPHNPMINAGAIITTSLIKNGMTLADRYDFVLNEYRKLAAGEHIGFNNGTFLSERDTADRNYALSYYMKEYNCFPPGIATLREELDLYFQLCSLETTCDTLAVMAATLANGGVCPLTGERCVAAQPCRDVLSLMYSCGMYDLSGKFAFQVGLPAKSGVSGAMIVVVPNVMGICLFSPPLDKTGNSTRGVTFCRKLIDTFKFHNYDSLLNGDSKKSDPRRKLGDRDTEAVVGLLFAAKHGDLDVIKRMYLEGANLEASDYDGRTALQVAAAEGNSRCVRFLLRTAKVDASRKDRWGHTALEEAVMFKHSRCVRLLRKHAEVGFDDHIGYEEEDISSEDSEEEGYLRRTRSLRSGSCATSTQLRGEDEPDDAEAEADRIIDDLIDRSRDLARTHQPQQEGAADEERTSTDHERTPTCNSVNFMLGYADSGYTS